MDPKKHKKFDLESKRGTFFLIGLAISLLSAIYIIQIETVTFISSEPDGDLPTLDASKPIPITYAPEPEKKQRKVEQKQEQKTTEKKVLDDILQIDDLGSANDDEGETGVDDFKGKPSDVDFDDEEGEVVTGNIASLQWVAAPMPCAGINDNDARRDCLNDWIFKYVNTNASYPKISYTMGVEETIHVAFIVDEKGDITNVKVVRGEDPALKEEALRVVKQMPRFDPARQQARKARMRMTVPVSFKIR